MSKPISAKFDDVLPPSTAGPLLLVSVRSVAEAREAICAGVDILDVKEPHSGSLGAASAETINAIGAAARSAVPISAAFGEIRQITTPIPAMTGISLIKAGPSGCQSADEYLDRCERLLPEQPLSVAVAYADHSKAAAPTPESLAAATAARNRPWFLIDTFTKLGNSLFDHLDVDQVSRIVRELHQHGCRVALAGSLRLSDLPRVRETNADVVAVRGLVCEGGRTGRVARQKVTQLKRKLAEAPHSLMRTVETQ